MPSGEYFCEPPSCVCPSCGTDIKENYRHGPDCIANLPGSKNTAALVPLWNQGWNAFIRSGGRPIIVPKKLKGLKKTAFEMGLRSARTMRPTALRMELSFQERLKPYINFISEESTPTI